MGQAVERNDMILLLDYYNTYSEELFHSFQRAGYDCPVVVIEDDGFLPDGVQSVFGFFMGDFSKSKRCPGRPLYFNEIEVPDYWEISGDNRSGKVCDLYRERGRIFYTEPKNKRLVKVVDWLDEKGVVRSSDHYNRYGALYARTIFNAKGQKVNKSWFSPDGQEVIMENYVTGDIILNKGEEIRFFRSKTAFVLHFLVEARFSQSRLFFNSLSTPFFVSQAMRAEKKRDVLFWQESVYDEIPGNMQMILKGQATRTEHIMVQLPKAYDRLTELGADRKVVHPLGFIYEFKKENKGQPKALICTNSDNIEHCKELVEALPKMEFHIAALTEMSSKLLSMEKYKNVRLYPGAKTVLIDELFEECDYYLDINHESEIVSAVRKAFLHNQLIFAFKETLHNADYVAKENIYKAADFAGMADEVKQCLADSKILEEKLTLQRAAALAETVESYEKAPFSCF